MPSTGLYELSWLANGRHVYLRGMGSNVRALIQHHYKPVAPDQPEHSVGAAVHRFLADDTFTRFASSGDLVQDIEVPFLAINASDDPVVSYVPFDHKSKNDASRHIQMMSTFVREFLIRAFGTANCCNGGGIIHVGSAKEAEQRQDERSPAFACQVESQVFADPLTEHSILATVHRSITIMIVLIRSERKHDHDNH
ncbi:hypothetical protein DFH09DRAFT_1276506 [Mycena vulgaris]|nr:hypothetical protein DFH09DRAFT_1276506 [Mycena vulgaris]